MTDLNETLHAIIGGIVRDLTDRGGLQNEWENIDEETRGDIQTAWFNVAERHVRAYLAALPSSSPPKAAETPEAVIANLARDLVALWQAQKISGASRADRNAAIESVRGQLIEAVSAAPKGAAGEGKSTCAAVTEPQAAASRGASTTGEKQ